jgi:uncharacterized protein YkwD
LAAIGAVLAPAAAAAPVPDTAAAGACPTRAALSASATVQEQAMLCLVNVARRHHGLGELAAVASLARAAERKSADIIRCNGFEHEACGRPFDHWIKRFAYRGCAVAENIAWGTGSLGGVPSIFRAWMRSPGHRENILGPYEEVGIGLRVGSLEGNSGAHVWTQDFGARC